MQKIYLNVHTPASSKIRHKQKHRTPQHFKQGVILRLSIFSRWHILKLHVQIKYIQIRRSEKVAMWLNDSCLRLRILFEILIFQSFRTEHAIPDLLRLRFPQQLLRSEIHKADLKVIGKNLVGLVENSVAALHAQTMTCGYVFQEIQNIGTWQIPNCMCVYFFGFKKHV